MAFLNPQDETLSQPTSKTVCLSVCLSVSGEVSLPAWRPIFDIMLSLSLHSPKKGLSCFSRPDNYFSLIPACQGQSQPSIEARERDHFPSPLFSGSFLFHLFSSISLTLSHSPTSRPLFLFFSFLLSPPSSSPTSSTPLGLSPCHSHFLPSLRDPLGIDLLGDDGSESVGQSVGEKRRRCRRQK